MKNLCFSNSGSSELFRIPSSFKEKKNPKQPRNLYLGKNYFLKYLISFPQKFPFSGSFRCVRKARSTTTTPTTTTSTTTTTRRPEIHSRFTTSYYNPYPGQDGQAPCSPGFERNHLGACVGKFLILF